ncbi:MAG: flagellar basal body rod protein FlgC [Alphaproteobacteria bacterium]|nr:MAG: flagellar basal body rod protein FlgC [Alphaproteobacteria bacterium]
MNILDAMSVSSSGMRAQGDRLRAVSQNIANADTAANTPNADPYRRKTVIFQNELDRASGVQKVRVSEIIIDKSDDFRLKFMPDHPGADGNGYIRLPKINTLIEMMDMREAQRSYEANLGMVKVAKTMLGQTVDLLRG